MRVPPADVLSTGPSFVRFFMSLTRGRVPFATAILIIAGGLEISTARASERVDLVLALAADVSYSVDQREFQLQRQGYANAIKDRAFVKAVRSGPNGRIAVCFIEWSGPSWQTLQVGWTIIRDIDDAQRFGDKIINAPRTFSERTSISAAIDFASTQIDRAPFESDRHLIDISGDGDNNAGRGVTSARDDAVANGISINGLTIRNSKTREHTDPAGGIENYHRQNVIGGVGSFVMEAGSFDSFRSVLIKKLVTEIAVSEQSFCLNRADLASEDALSRNS
jgi:Protein of unknown function (DUF1194)